MVERTANKLISFTLIGIFIVLGILGLALPILPGILFLLIAAIMASRHSPALANYLEQNPYTAKSVHMSHRFSHLDFLGKVRICAWGVLKITMDSVEWGIRVIRKILRIK